MTNKISIILITLFTFTYFISCKSNQNIAIKTVNDGFMFQIQKIKKDKSLYVIYAQRNDSIFKIISDREFDKSCQNKIRVGNYYKLNLNVTFPAEKLYGNVGLDYATHMSFSYKKSIIKAEKESHYRIYIADNLEGLCLIE